MKVLFLDIDGVLNRKETEERCRGFIGVDRKLSDKLLTWLKNKDVNIVLSSSWRITNDYLGEDMLDHLKEAGLSWTGTTPIIRDVSAIRGDEIELYLNAHSEITHFAILDDDIAFHENQTNNFVNTNHEIGLEDKHLKQLERILEV